MRSTSRASQFPSSSLIERAGELRELWALLDRRRGVGLVEGEAGIGKSALLAAAATRGRECGALVLQSRGTEVEAALGFGVLRQLLEQFVGRLPARDRSALLQGVAALAAGVVDPTAPPADEGTDRSLAVVHALSWVIFRMAERQPLVLIVDDGHWADEASQRCLTYLADRLDGHDVVLLIGLRATEPGARPLQALSHRADVVVRPAALSALAVATVLRDRLGPGWVRAAEPLQRATGGNPLYVDQLVHRLAAGRHDPEQLSEMKLAQLGGVALARDVDARLRELGADARSLAVTLAVLGDPCPLDRAARAADLSLAAADLAAEQLIGRAVLSRTDALLTFLHPVIREAVLSLAPAGLHRQVAHFLAADGADDETVAAHLSRAAPDGDEWSVDVLRRAARRGLSRGAVEVALSLLDRALAEPPALHVLPDVLAEAGQAAAWVARSDFVELLTRAWEATEDPRSRALRALVLAKSLAALSRNVEAADVLTKAEVDLGEQHPDLALALRTQLVVVGLQDVRLVMRTLPAIASLAERPDDPAARELMGLMEANLIAMGGGSQEQTLQRLLGAPPAEDVDAVGWDVRAFTAFAVLSCGGYDEAHRMFAEAADHGNRLGSARARLTGTSGWQISAWLRGDLETSLTEGRAAVELCREMDAPDGGVVATAVLALALLDAGEAVEAAEVLEGAPDPEQHPHIWACLRYTALARLALLADDPRAAIAIIRRGDERFASLLPATVPSPALFSWRAPLIEALLLAGDSAAAATESALELQQARSWGGARAVGIALRDAARADPGSSEELLRESVAVLRAEGRHTLELGRSLAALWQLCADATSRDEGKAIARACGAAPLLAVLEGTPGPQGPASRLTRAERPVVELVAQGLTNAEVAARLHLSQATVKTHLLRAFDKLAVRNRTELARLWNQQSG